MKKTKKFLSILLSVLMIISAMPFSAVTALAIDEFVIDEDGVLTEYNGRGGNVVIPDGVTSIDGYVFNENETIISIEMPDTVISIGSYAFQGCTNLKNITFSNNLAIIQKMAFYECRSLDSIVIPKSVIEIGDSAFEQCRSLFSVTITDNIKSIGNRSFYLNFPTPNGEIITVYYHCDDDLEIIKSLVDAPAYCVLPHNFENYACTLCGFDEYIIDENGVLTGYNGDGGDIIIPNGVTTIVESAFEYNGSIESVVFPKSLTKIEDWAFSSCYNLKSVTIGDSITEVSPWAFWCSDQLETINCYCDSDLDAIKQKMSKVANNNFEYYCSHKWLDSTCIEPSKCSVCGFVSDTSYGSHNWKPATCISPSKCSFCGTLKDNIYGEHNWVEPTCTEDGYCSVCHEVAEPAYGHSFTERGERIRSQSCTESELYREECEYCGVEGEIVEGEPPLRHLIHYLLSIENNVYTYRCFFCNTIYTVDTNALISAIETAENEYINTGATKKQYLSIESLQNAVINAKNILGTISTELGRNNSEEPLQEDIDNATNAILDAINNLELKTYSVTVNKITDGDSTVVTTANVVYGEMFNAFVDLAENEAIYKWVMEADNKDVKLNTISQDISQVITGDTTFNCYVDNADTKAEDTARVVFYDKSNHVIAINYMPIGSSINSFNVMAPRVAFYSFTGWELISGNADSLTKEGASFRATYAPKDIEANKSTIVALGDIKVNGKQTTTEFYDARIELTGASNYAYCDADGNILQGINGNVIYAPNNSQTIYVCAGVSDKASTSITGVIDDANKLTINAQYYLPSDCTVVEAGIVISKTNENPTINGTGCQALKSSQQGSSGEYSISLKYSTTGTIYAVSYLTYKDNNGTLHTIYSDTQAITFGA